MSIYAERTLRWPGLSELVNILSITFITVTRLTSAVNQCRGHLDSIRQRAGFAVESDTALRNFVDLMRVAKGR